MKILIVNKFLYNNGGSETYIFEIGKELARMGHQVQYFGMDHSERKVGNHAESYTSNVDFHKKSIRNILYPFKIIYSIEARKKIRTVLLDFKPDVIHLNNINFQITPSIIDEINKYDRNINIVYTAHDYQWICPNHMLKIPSSKKLCTKCVNGKYFNCTINNCIHNSKLQSILGTIEAELYKIKNTYRRVNTVICPSNFMKCELDHNPQLREHTLVLHNFTPFTKDIATTVEHENSSIQKRYILYYGRYSTEKGIETLIKACYLLPNIQFIFAGKGELADKIRKVPNISEVGFKTGDDLQELIKNAEFTVYPSEWYENCPLTIMESQQLGTPVVTSNIGGIAELIIPGKTAELFPAGNVDALANTINTLWNNQEKLKNMRKWCLIHSKKDFLTINQYCKLLEKIYMGDSAITK